MRDRRRAWIWLEALVSLVAGLVLVLNDSAAAWMLILLGILSLGLLPRRGSQPAAADTRSARWGLIGAAALAVLPVAIAAVVLLRR